eukprot:242992_1
MRMAYPWTGVWQWNVFHWVGQRTVFHWVSSAHKQFHPNGNFCPAPLCWTCGKWKFVRSQQHLPAPPGLLHLLYHSLPDNTRRKPTTSPAVPQPGLLDDDTRHKPRIPPPPPPTAPKPAPPTAPKPKPAQKSLAAIRAAKIEAPTIDIEQEQSLGAPETLSTRDLKAFFKKKEAEAAAAASAPNFNHQAKTKFKDWTSHGRLPTVEQAGKNAAQQKLEPENATQRRQIAHACPLSPTEQMQAELATLATGGFEVRKAAVAAGIADRIAQTTTKEETPKPHVPSSKTPEFQERIAVIQRTMRTKKREDEQRQQAKEKEESRPLTTLQEVITGSQGKPVPPPPPPPPPPPAAAPA